MFQLRIASGRQAGTEVPVRRFPFRVGRDPKMDCPADEPGLWAQHAELLLQPATGCVLRSCSDAITTVNGQVTQETRLRNGDLIGMGSLKLRFWLAPAPQRGFALREVLTWGLLTAITAGQVLLIHWLAA